MKTLTSIGLILLLTAHLMAQNGNQQNPFQASTPVDRLSLGLGGGLDYGGFGGNLSFYPIDNVGIFGGIGYALAGVGFNGGLKYRFIPKKPDARVRPFGLAMYGYNAAIAVLNASQHNKLFYGPTLGAGIDFQRNLQRRGYWSFALFVPIRNSEVQSYMDDLENLYNVDFQTSLFPVAVSIGYKFILL
jgi:hypothetical protein